MAQRLSFRTLPIALPLAILLVMAIAAPVFVVSFIDNADARSAAIDSIRAHNLQQVNRTVASLDSALTNSHRALEFLASLPAISRLLSSPNDPDTFQTVQSMLRKSRQLQGFDVVYVADRSGQVIAASRDDLMGRNYRAARWFGTAMAGEVAVDEPTYDLEDHRTFLHVSAPVRNAEGIIHGAVLARFSMAAIDDLIFPDTNTLSNVYGMLWDERMVELANGGDSDQRFIPLFPVSPDSAAPMILESRYGPDTQSLLARSANQIELKRLTQDLFYDPTANPYARIQMGQSLWVTAAPLRTKRWIYALFEPESVVMESIDPLSRRSLAIALLVSGIAAVLALALAAWVVRPLRSRASANRLADSKRL